MNPNYLDFEQPIADLQAKIEELRLVGNDNALNISDEIARLQEKSQALTKSIFSDLSSWQVARLARHPLRPYTLDYIGYLFTDFEELHGDRHFADDPAIVGGIARLDGRPVMVIGHQKGREVREKVRRNFGMPRPEGYRKACRLMEMAERFKMPILTFIDTPGAYPGIDAEERGQSEAIAWNLRVMARLKTPIIATVIGEGGSGGALAIRCLRPAQHAAALDLLGDLAGRLRLHPVEDRREGSRCRRGHGYHRRAPEEPEHRRPGDRRASGWRSSRSPGDGRQPAQRAVATTRRPQGL
ncbi:acetyl-CoA carboxylase carboxyl transferase alpha subunit [Pseudomonas psychrotolerans]|nr:acetyl-CoA carboxylase carboxyl transferase alpha subunit [Pseudomonas psychrotolerans]